jgi:hypothetical protein
VLKTLREALKLDMAKEEIEELEAKSGNIRLLEQCRAAQKVLQQIKKLKDKCETYDKLV